MSGAAFCVIKLHYIKKVLHPMCDSLPNNTLSSTTMTIFNFCPHYSENPVKILVDHIHLG